MQIEKDIPFKPGYRKNYPWPDMDVGDSVLFDEFATASQSSPASAARKWGRNNGKKFSCRKEGEGVRIWRVE